MVTGTLPPLKIAPRRFRVYQARRDEVHLSGPGLRVKVAIHNPFIGGQFAENELVIRMIRAIENLGHAGHEASSLDDLEQIAPDFVLVLHQTLPKISRFPTYGCMWNPPGYFEGVQETRRNVQTYDGYFFGSQPIHDWVQDLLQFHPKSEDLGLLIPTVNWAEFAPSPRLASGDARLAYFGSNWEGRHRGTFERLDGTGLLDVYGKKQGWSFLPGSYRGSVPFDGSAVVRTIAAAGAGLCLHSPFHIEAGVPTMRVFEAVAAGAVAISDRHPFVEQRFKDSVLYVDDSSPAGVASAIERHVAWVRANPDASIAMARRAHDVLREYSLEHLLGGVIEVHRRRLARQVPRHAATEVAPEVAPEVQVVVRTGGRAALFLRRALTSLATQIHPRIRAVVVAFDNHAMVESVLREFPNLPSTLVKSEKTGFRSTQLLDGLRSITSEYFAILDDDDIAYDTHYDDLIAILEGNPRVDLAYSGSVRIVERSNSPGEASNATVALFDDFSALRLMRFDNYIASNAFVARSRVLRSFSLEDPRLIVCEDMYLLFRILRYSDFQFSWKVSCAFCWRGDNSHFLNEKVWEAARTRLTRIFNLESLEGRGAQELATEVISLRKQLAAVLNSRSWRMTRVYRDLGRRLKTLLGR